MKGDVGLTVMLHQGCGAIKGVGDNLVRILHEFALVVKMFRVKMEQSRFRVIEKNSGHYDMILGYDFMKSNKLVLHPHLNLIECLSHQGETMVVYLADDSSA